MTNLYKMGRTESRIVDESATGLYDGLKNLATGYFDSISEFNQSHAKKKFHFSFQTVKDLDWKDAVKKVLGSETVKDVLEKGKSMLADVVKLGAGAAVGVATGGAASLGAILSEAGLGAFTEMIVDGATAAFSQGGDKEENTVQGTWVYVYRGKENNKLVRAGELASESTMFQDYDDTLQRDDARKLYSPGFYISRLTATNQDIVYVFDTEEPVTVAAADVRVADQGDQSRFDADPGMTLIRELYFDRLLVNTVKYPKFQKGDEVLYRGKPYTVTGGDAETIHLRDRFNNTKEADPQACTAGPRDHWRATEPDQFRTVQFTFTIGDFAYRPIQGGDVPPTSRANGVLCCIFYYSAQQVEVYDCWTGESSIVMPNELVAPPIPVRRLLNNMEFLNFQKRVVKRMSPEHHKLTLHTQYEEVCWAYDMTMTFMDTRVLTADRQQTQITLGAEQTKEGEVVMEQTYVKPDPVVGNNIPNNLWIAGGLILAGIYFL